MYNNLRRKEKCCGGLLFISVGIFFFILFFFIFIYPAVKKINYDEHTYAYQIEEGKFNDTDNEIMYKPIYFFNVSDQIYKCESKVAESRSPDNKANLVYYDRSNPENCLTEYETYRPFYIYFFFVIPLIPIIVGICYMKNSCIKEKNNYSNIANNEKSNSSPLKTSSEKSKNDSINDKPKSAISSNINNYNNPVYNYSNVTDLNDANANNSNSNSYYRIND